MIRRESQLDALHPRLGAFARWADGQLQGSGVYSGIAISEGVRSAQTQAEYYRLGRDAPQELVDRYQPGQLAPGTRNTNAKGPDDAPHLVGLAFDAVVLDAQGNELWQDTRAWDRWGTLVTQFNAAVPGLPLVWGGTFRSPKDSPHVELGSWASLKDWASAAGGDEVAEEDEGAASSALGPVVALVFVGVGLAAFLLTR